MVIDFEFYDLNGPPITFCEYLKFACPQLVSRYMTYSEEQAMDRTVASPIMKIDMLSKKNPYLNKDALLYMHYKLEESLVSTFFKEKLTVF